MKLSQLTETAISACCRLETLAQWLDIAEDEAESYRFQIDFLNSEAMLSDQERSRIGYKIGKCEIKARLIRRRALELAPTFRGERQRLADRVAQLERENAQLRALMPKQKESV